MLRGAFGCEGVVEIIEIDGMVFAQREQGADIVACFFPLTPRENLNSEIGTENAIGDSILGLQIATQDVRIAGGALIGQDVGVEIAFTKGYAQIALL